MEILDFFVENKIVFVVFHVLSVIVGMGSAVVSDILFNFYSEDKTLNDSERKSLELLSSTIWISLIVIIMSGMAIFLSDPEKYISSQKFITKMVIMIVLLLNGLFLSKFVSPHFSDKGLLKFKNKRSIRQWAFVGGAISVTSWIIVCILGVIKSIPFQASEALLIYLVTIIFAILSALFLEKRTFSKNA